MLVSVTEEPLNQDLFYQNDDVINKLKALNKELVTKNKTIASRNKNNLDVSKFEEEAERIKIEITRLQNVICNSTDVNQLKTVLTKIIEHVLYQRFLAVSNIREISEDSNIQELFSHLQSVSNVGPSTSSSSSSSSSSGFGHQLSPAFFSILPKIVSVIIPTDLPSSHMCSTSSSSSIPDPSDSSFNP